MSFNVIWHRNGYFLSLVILKLDSFCWIFIKLSIFAIGLLCHPVKRLVKVASTLDGAKQGHFFFLSKPVPNRVKFWSSLKRTFDMSFHLMFKVELTITARTVKSRFLFVFHLNVVKECFVFERLECAQMTHFQLTFVRMSLTIIWGHSRFFVRARHETT